MASTKPRNFNVAPIAGYQRLIAYGFDEVNKIKTRARANIWANVQFKRGRW